MGCRRIIAAVVACVLAAAAAAPAGADRQTLPLNDGWKFFRADVTRFDEATNWSAVTLPHTWNATDAQSGSGWYAGIGWYQKDLGTMEQAKDRRVVLRFEGAGSVAEVFVNGTRVGEHRGSYGAFAFDVTESITPGKANVVRVKVDNRARPDVLPVNDYLFTIFGGLYRPASLILQDPVHIFACDHASSGVVLSQTALDDSLGRLAVSVQLRNAGARSAPVSLRVRVLDAGGAEVAAAVRECTLPPGPVQAHTLSVDVPSPRRWRGLPDPYLYRIVVEVRRGDEVLDSVTERWGFRTCAFDARGAFLLNGQRYPLHGVCRHQERQDKGNALSEADHAADMELVRAIGATTVRFAHYQQSDTMYRLCDEMGVLAWAEIPFVNAVTGEEAANASEQLVDLIRQSRNHPSIFVWGLHNEVYGKKDTDTAPAVTRELHALARREDPSRPTIAVTGSGDPVQPVSYIADLQGVNRYFGWYGGKDPAKLEEWIERMNRERPDNPVALSEYGAEANIAQQCEAIPDPFPDPVRGQYFPEIVQTRLHEVQWAILERHPEVWASYIWNLCDFTVPLWNRGGVPGRNMKGLVTYDRAVKKDAFHWYRVNWNASPAVHVADLRIPRRAGKAFDLPIYANRPGVQVRIDGTQVSALERGVNDRHFWARGVVLGEGVHAVEAHIANADGTPAAVARGEITVGP